MHQIRQNAGAQALLVSQHVYKQARRLIQSGMKEDAGVLLGLVHYYTDVRFYCRERSRNEVSNVNQAV